MHLHSVGRWKYEDPCGNLFEGCIIKGKVRQKNECNIGESIDSCPSPCNHCIDAEESHLYRKQHDGSGLVAGYTSNVQAWIISSARIVLRIFVVGDTKTFCLEWCEVYGGKCTRSIEGGHNELLEKS